MKREYTVEVRFDGRIRVVKVQAISPAHARAMALERCNISVSVRT